MNQFALLCNIQSEVYSLRLVQSGTCLEHDQSRTIERKARAFAQESWLEFSICDRFSSRINGQSKSRKMIDLDEMDHQERVINFNLVKSVVDAVGRSAWAKKNNIDLAHHRHHHDGQGKCRHPDSVRPIHRYEHR